MAKFKAQHMTQKLMCYHYKFVFLSKLQAFLLLQNNLCFNKNSHILQNPKLKIIGHIGKKQGWSRPV